LLCTLNPANLVEGGRAQRAIATERTQHEKKLPVKGPSLGRGRDRAAHAPAGELEVGFPSQAEENRR